jgi:aminoglycoside phosphotransferase (APT) family kinase protein
MWQHAPVWVHGDVSQGNLLLRDGRPCAVIDFGSCCVGDPACDSVIAWTLFDGDSRAAFRAALALDEATWARARGWVVWKALIVASGLASTNALYWAQPWRVTEDLLRALAP